MSTLDLAMFLPEIKFERQTILATKYAGEILGDPFGYPLRLRTSTKLGYKNAKWIRAIEVSNDFRKTYWSERGFNWYAGIYLIADVK
jgi:DMSO/TMAO reductase YedYZ molybdopterin-dependent catalytic subunit